MSSALIIEIRLEPRALDAERTRVPDLVQFPEDHEPRLIAFNEYADDHPEGITVMQIHPHAKTLYATVALERSSTSDEQTNADQRRGAGNGRPTIRPDHLGDVTRSR